MGCDGTCEAINMRGFNQYGGAMVDGFVAINAGGVTNLSNVDRIEVVKGPASVLYGRMEPGGVVNIVTKKPQSIRSASIEQTVGTYSTRVTEFDTTGPIDEAKTFLYRLNGSWDRHDLYIKGLKNERQFIAPSLQWNLGARTQALMELTYDHARFPWQRELYPQDPVTLEPVYFPWSSNITPYSQTTETTEARLGLTHAFNDDWSVKLQARTTHSRNTTDPNSWSIGWMDQLNGEWRIWRTRADGNGTADNNALQADVTGHFATGGAKHTLLFGADASRQKTFTNAGNSVDAAAFDYFYDITNALNPVAPTADLPVNAWWGTRNEESRRGVYLQDQIELPHNVHLVAGLRYSKVTFDSKDEVSGVWVTDFGVDALKIRSTRQDSAVTKRLGALWELRPGTSVYASYTENFGNYQGAFDFEGNALDPQLAKQKEVGLKQQSADGKWTGSVAIYDLRKTNVQVLDPDHTGCRDTITGFPGTPGVSPCYRAAGLTRARGVELDLVGEVMPGWNVIANYSYNQTRVLKDDLPPADSWVGKSPGYYPQNMAKLATTYRFTEGLLSGWKLGGAVTHTGQTDLGNSSPQQTITPGYTLVDLMAGYAFKLGGYKAEVQLNVKNATDKEVRITASEGFFTSVGRGDPRQVFAKLRVDF
jgi:iron complex outermembrane receptor protein